MSGHCCVPEDIVEEILHRLPPKSIGKCMAVCKSWNLLIKSHRFLSSYQPPRSLSSTPLFLVQNTDNQYCLCSPTNMTESSFSIPRDEYTFVGAVNGLVCLSPRNHRKTKCGSNMNFILFNPLTRTHLRLPFSQTLYNSYGVSKKKDFNMDWGLLYGFGFDSKKNDFKVVHIGCFNVPPKVEFYSLKEGVWRNTPFDQDLFNYGDTRYGQQLFFQDSVHWLACKTGRYSNPWIVMFNVVEEKFSKMELPQVLAKNSSGLSNITVIDGCLSLIQYPQQPGDNTNIWMKREESWSKMYTLSLCGVNIIQLLGQNLSSQVLVLLSPDYSYGKIMYSYDLKSQEIRDLGVKGSWSMSLCASDFSYSLFILDKLRKQY